MRSVSIGLSLKQMYKNHVAFFLFVFGFVIVDLKLQTSGCFSLQFRFIKHSFLFLWASCCILLHLCNEKQPMLFRASSSDDLVPSGTTAGVKTGIFDSHELKATTLG